MSSVTFEHVTKKFGDTIILDDVHLHIHDEEFLVLVGPSGCGKSTTLRCLAGFEQITRGNIYIGKRLVTHVPPQERDIAMVFQNYALYPHMTAYDNMAFSLRMRTEKGVFKRKRQDETEIDRRVREAAALLDIEPLLSRKPQQLSGGQQQRVALGRALVRDATVFLMDEPLSNLDARLRTQMRTEISKLHRRIKTTFVYVTHDQTEALSMGTRIAVMYAGQLQQVDTPQVLYDHPANTFVAAFIGSFSPAMHFFEAHLDYEHGEMVAHISGLGRLTVPPAWIAPLDPYIGKPIILGMRPEHIHDAHLLPSGITYPSGIQATVGLVERMGSEVYVYFEQGNHPFVGRFDGRTRVQQGERVDIVFAMEKMHVFDWHTEQAIAMG